MQICIMVLTSIFLWSGCVRAFGEQEVTFVYFNLGTNRIWVDAVVGLPSWASPGLLAPVRGEDQLSEKSMTSFSETVRVSDKLKIIWKENGQQGWPGRLKPGVSPPGIVHEAEFKRDDLKIPAKMKNGKIWFTYVGNDKWRVKFLKE